MLALKVDCSQPSALGRGVIRMIVTHQVHLLLLPVAEALKNFQERLTEFEQEEIMDYAEIWFLGLGSQKIEGSQSAPQNSGYDDEHGSYIRVTC